MKAAYHQIDLAISKASFSEACELLSRLDPQLVRVEDRIRSLGNPAGAVEPYVGPPGGPHLERSIMHGDRPWRDVSFRRVDVPGMITDEEIRYYHWLARYYSGQYAAVELGPWLGHSTIHLAESLGPVLCRHGRRMHVYDDFVWRPGWMNQYLRPHDPPAPGMHESFEHIFQHFTAAVGDLLEVQRGKITDYDGNERLRPITWCGEQIELMVVDCGRTIHANEAWFDLFSPYFIPDRTLVVMQDWRLHRERPRKPYNQTWHFVASHPCLELVHEVIDGGIATFLYRNEATHKA